MNMLPFILLLSLLFVFNDIKSQHFLKGKVYDADTDSVIGGVNVFNKTQRRLTRSAADGSYSIAATEGDVIIFSISGFKPDTFIARFDLLITQHDPGLHRQIISLEVVKVTSNYRTDSLNRRNYYSHIHAKQPGLTGHNRPADGLGVTLSPLSFFSRETKQKRTLRKRLEKQERDFFIDQSFSLAFVKNGTGLSGDSLSLFMYRYRPSYSFCRRTDHQGMILYVNDKLKEFRNPVKD